MNDHNDHTRKVEIVSFESCLFGGQTSFVSYHFDTSLSHYHHYTEVEVRVAILGQDLNLYFGVNKQV